MISLMRGTPRVICEHHMIQGIRSRISHLYVHFCCKGTLKSILKNQLWLQLKKDRKQNKKQEGGKPLERRGNSSTIYRF